MHLFTYFALPFPFGLDLLLSPLPLLTRFAITAVSSSKDSGPSDSCVLLLSRVAVSPCASSGNRDSPSSAWELQSSCACLPAVLHSILVISVKRICNVESRYKFPFYIRFLTSIDTLRIAHIITCVRGNLCVLSLQVRRKWLPLREVDATMVHCN